MFNGKRKYFAFGMIAVIGFLVSIYAIYYKDKKKFEPKLWIGFFNYRLNFRDVGESLNQCLGKEVFQKGIVYRSNKYFSGWSCEKINSPHKIYSLNYSVNEPHSYYCFQKDGSKQFGLHPNTTFEITDIESFKNWEKPEFKNTMCTLFKESLLDVTNRSSFLFHCDVGRDRTGAFAAMLSMAMAEQKNLPFHEIVDAIECDYEKTSALEKHKKGKMKLFLSEVEKQGGVSRFLETQCGLSKETILNAAGQFIF